MDQIDKKRAIQLKKWCDYFDIEMMVSPISEKGYEISKKIKLKRYKIASRTVVENPRLCKKIIKENSEIICSLGFWKKSYLQQLRSKIL